MATYAREPEGVGFSTAGTFGGTLAAIGMLALIAGIVTAVGAAISVDIDFTRTEWRAIGWGGAAALAAALLISFLFGGYIAGRMALGSGFRNGMWVFVTGLVIFGTAWLLTWQFVGAGTIGERLADLDVPADGDMWTDIGIGGGTACALGMLIGAVLGGLMGGRWRPAVEYRETDLRDQIDVRETRADRTDLMDHEPSVEEERELTRHRRAG